MRNDFYVGISGQLALERRLETIANNVANVNTTGFRSEEVRFDSVLSDAGARNVAYSRIGGTHLSRAAGGLTHTGNPLDVAVEGDAWLAVSTAAGTVYTRDGRAKISPNGELQSMTGAPFLDVGGSPIIVDPSAGEVAIGRDGRITQNDRQVGALGVFMIPETAKLERFEGSGVIPDVPAEPVVEFSRAGLVQGYLEGSNVNPVKEITRLIAVQRSFDAVTQALGLAENVHEAALRDLGGAR